MSTRSKNLNGDTVNECKSWTRWCYHSVYRPVRAWQRLEHRCWSTVRDACQDGDWNENITRYSTRVSSQYNLLRCQLECAGRLKKLFRKLQCGQAYMYSGTERELFCHNFAFERRLYDRGLGPRVIDRGHSKAPDTRSGGACGFYFKRLRLLARRGHCGYDTYFEFIFIIIVILPLIPRRHQVGQICPFA